MTERMEPPDAPPETVAELRAAFREYRPTAGIAVTGVRGREVDLQFPDGSLHTAVLKRPPGRPPKRGRPTGAQALPPAGKLAQHTFPEAKTVSAGLADGPKQRGWGELEGEPSLMHRLDDDAPLATVVRGGPFLDWLGLPATAEGLREELRQAGLPAVLLLHVLIGGSLVRSSSATGSTSPSPPTTSSRPSAGSPVPPSSGRRCGARSGAGWPCWTPAR